MKKVLKWIAIILLPSVLIALIIIFAYLNSTLPRTEGTVQIHGIKNSIYISRNGYGIPRIIADNTDDMYFAIGYVHASDRLFQMDMVRRLATGRLSELMGKKTLHIDTYYKGLMTEDSIRKTMAEPLPEPIKKILSQYCRGVNSYIENEILPVEFKLLGYKPEKWTPFDIYTVFKNMENILAGSGNELNNLKLTRALGPEIASRLIRGTFGTTIIREDEMGKDLSNAALRQFADLELAQLSSGIGSNNWVISGKKTQKGLPILANDPHLSNVFPSYFYQIYASDGKRIFSGNTIAGVPFIIIGRNESLGWGFTNTGTDVIDYFRLKVNEKGNQYHFDGNWLDFKTVVKSIQVKGQADHKHRIRMTHLGPVYQDGKSQFVRHSIMEYPSTSLKAFYLMNISSSVSEFMDAMRHFSSPAQNVVFADQLGTIGYYPAGWIPKRRKGDGSLPVILTGESDLWDGFIDENRKPFLINPAKGFIVTANNAVIDAGSLPIFSINWYPSFRADRITELIQAKGRLSVADNQAIQSDTYLKSAGFLLGFLKDMRCKNPDAQSLLKRFREWNKCADGGIEPFLFYEFQRRLVSAIFDDELKKNGSNMTPSRSWLYKLLDYPGQSKSPLLSRLADDVRTEAPESFEMAVQKALLEVHRSYLSNEKEINRIQWEHLHTLHYKHPLGSVKFLAPLLNRGPHFMKGGKDCVLSASFRSKNYRITWLSAFRMIIDFSDFSNSMMINSSGQSEHFMSPHYDDQIELYTQLKYRKMEDFRENDADMKKGLLVLEPKK